MTNRQLKLIYAAVETEMQSPLMHPESRRHYELHEILVELDRILERRKTRPGLHHDHTSS